MTNMRIITKTGSVYQIDQGFCVKRDANGTYIDSFKAWTIKALPDEVTTWDEIHALPFGEPEVGKRMYIAGKDVFWISTRVVSVS